MYYCEINLIVVSLKAIFLVVSYLVPSKINGDKLKYNLLKLGKIKLMLIITSFSILVAISTDILIAVALNHELKASEDLVRAAIIPLFIAPIISWFFLGLLYELDAFQQKMEVHANHDDLTGLLNRRGFFSSCNVLHELALRSKQPYSILAIDLDYFKKINDQYGHRGGDSVLERFGEISRQLSRKSDVIGRLGGEEFFFFLPNTDLKQATNFTQKLFKTIRNTKVAYTNNHIRFSISIGIATNLSNDLISLEEALKHADSALYTAKNSGRNQFSLYNTDTTEL